MLLFSYGLLLQHHIKEGKKRKRRERNHISYTTVSPLLSYDQMSTTGMSGRKLLWRKMLLRSEARRKPGGLQQLLLLSSMYAAVVVTDISLQSLFLHTINQ